MKVLLVQAASAIIRQKACAPLGLVSIATYLNANGHTCRIYDRDLNSKGSIAKKIKAFSPDIIGISTHSLKSFKDAIKVSQAAKKLGIDVAWGGAMPTSIYDLVLNDGYAKYIIMSEGEATWLELCNVLEKGGKPVYEVSGLALKKDGQPFVTPPREFMDLALLPDLDWSLVNPEGYYWKDYIGCDNMLYLYASKGCIGCCAFCYNKPFHRCTWRGRPLDQVLDEIDYLMKNHGMDGVYFADELFANRAERMREYCNKILERGMKFTWGMDARIGQYDREDMELMYKAGCRWIFYGIESGSPSMHKRIHKNISLERAVVDFRNCKELGITSWASVIIGFPDETVEQLHETVDFCKKLDATLYPLQYFKPQPGAEMFDYCVEHGLFKAPKTVMEWADFKLFDTVKPNLSKIPIRDLKVVLNYYLWNSFTHDFSNANHSKVFAFKAVVHTLEKTFTRGFFSGIKGLFSGAKEFITVFVNAKCFPGIIKKYGLKD